MADIEMTVAQLREWLRNWIADATGQPVSQISDDRPMEEFGLRREMLSHSAATSRISSVSR